MNAEHPARGDKFHFAVTMAINGHAGYLSQVFKMYRGKDARIAKLEARLALATKALEKLLPQSESHPGYHHPDCVVARAALKEIGGE